MRRAGLAVAIVWGACLWATAAASGATFSVNSAADEAAAGLATDGICDSDIAPLVVRCTLRAAVQEANGTPGADTILLPALGPAYALTLAPSGEDLSAGGDLDVRSALTLTGSGRPVIDGQGADRVFHVGPGGTSPTFSVSGVEIRNGGGVAAGGGLYVESGTLGLGTSTIAGNQAQSAVGTASGAGISIDSPGPHAISASTFSGNTAEGLDGHGGGLEVGPGASLSITNSTVTANAATGTAGPGFGGGLFVGGGGVALFHVTMDGNAATGSVPSAGGTIELAGGSVTLRATIVSGGISDPGLGNCGASAGNFASQGSNLEAPAPSPFVSQCSLSALAADRLLDSAQLAGLADRGGPTQTQALLTASQALDAIPSCFPFTSDQRGLPRPSGPACDIGAFERQVQAPPGVGCFGRVPTIVATGATASVVGTEQADVILGSARGELIIGGGGADLICAGKGNDRVLGGADADKIAGADGKDRLFGQAQNDTLLGNAGADRLDGGPGRDRLNGGARVDVCRGGARDKRKNC